MRRILRKYTIWQCRRIDIRKSFNTKAGGRYEKPTFGSTKLADDMKVLAEKEDIAIELVGLCTDICVVSNALLLKAAMPEVEVSVDATCCAGVTPTSHEAALVTMRSCQINVKE